MQEAGWWDIVALLYTPAAQAVGLPLLHQLVPGWMQIEAIVKVRDVQHVFIRSSVIAVLASHHLRP